MPTFPLNSRKSKAFTGHGRLSPMTSRLGYRTKGGILDCALTVEFLGCLLSGAGHLLAGHTFSHSLGLGAMPIPRSLNSRRNGILGRHARMSGMKVKRADICASVAQFFTASAVNRMRQPICEIANYLIDGFVDKGQCDFMNDLEGQKLHYLPTFTVLALEKLLIQWNTASPTG